MFQLNKTWVTAAFLTDWLVSVEGVKSWGVLLRQCGRKGDFLFIIPFRSAEEFSSR